VEAQLRRALRLHENALGPDSVQVAVTLTNIGLALEQADRHREARTQFRRALAIGEKVLGATHPNLAYPLTGLGIAEEHLGAPGAAAVVLERALALRLTNPGRPTELAETRFALASALWDLGQKERARTLATQARKTYAAVSAETKSLAEVERWLQDHSR
jgi:tetratricopeptide (TPR) repeat protein